MCVVNLVVNWRGEFTLADERVGMSSINLF